MDKRFVRSQGREAFTGNELILKGSLEGGINLLTGYPGSPVADVFEAAHSISDYLKENGILAQLANNEALAGARLNGSQLEDLRAVAVMKSVGFNVAADGLFTGSMGKTGHRGGAVIVVGDDPWSDSTQVPQDSRRLSDHLFIPVLEPSTFQEVKDWLKLAFELSAASDLYVTYLITTNQADGGGSVEVRANQLPRDASVLRKKNLRTSQIQVDHSILLPPHTGQREEEALKVKFPALLQACRAMGLNRLVRGREEGGLGFISAGLPYAYLEQALSEFGMAGRFPILKLGMTYPVDPQAVRDFLKHAGTLVVVEEKRSFVETQVRDILFGLVQGGEIKSMPALWGKAFPGGLKPIPAERGLNPARLMRRLGPLLKHMGLSSSRVDEELAFLEKLAGFEVKIPARTPTFCPGCPHRDSTSVFLDLVADFKNADYMRRRHSSDPIDIVFHGDAGCYSMLYFAPNQALMHNYSGMGLGGGTGAGLTPFTTNKSITFIGDGTFFHSGLAAASDSIKNGQDILYVILDNKTTAMTGHQPHPGVEEDLMGNFTFAQDIEKTLKGLTQGDDVSVLRVNPESREDYRAAVEDMLMEPGVKFLIADKECGITYHRRKRRERSRLVAQKGFLASEKRVNVSDSACEYCLECTRLTGCPGLTVEDTSYGPKIATDLSNCVSDGACYRVHACPSFEEVTILRGRKPEAPELPQESSLPLPASPSLKGDWRAYLCGIGGMGIGSTTAVLVRAGMRRGYFVNFCDKKGLAIRNGGVYSHIVFSTDDKVVSPVTPYGKADLVLGVDLLEAVRGVDPKFNLQVGSPEHSHCVVNTAKTPTILSLLGKDNFQPKDLEATLKKASRSYFGVNVSQVSQKLMGHTLYANTMMLGLAFQLGRLPLALEDLLGAIQENFRPEEARRNVQAFHLGRDLALHPEKYGAEKKVSLQEVVDKKAGLLGSLRARHYREMVASFMKEFSHELETPKLLAERLYDLIEWKNVDYARQYLNRVLETLKKDSSEYGWAATKAVVKYLHKVMAIKDEIYVAHLLTSKEKYEKDRERYGVDPKRGDRIRYKHFNRPAFDVMGMHLEFRLDSRDWMLQVMKRMKFLRELMPQWHAKEKAFREWYAGLVDRFRYQSREQYQKWIKILELPEMVRGYRDVRYPHMEAARKLAQEILATLEASPQASLAALAA